MLLHRVTCSLLTQLVQGIDWCQLDVSPAAAVLTRLTLLSLRENRLTDMADVVPAGAGHSLQVLDISGNYFGEEPGDTAPWSAANMAAFSSGNWANLRVLGTRPALNFDEMDGFEATADALGTVLLQHQAAAAQPPRPAPVVVYAELHGKISATEDLAVVT